jgi:hypothetical protein
MDSIPRIVYVSSGGFIDVTADDPVSGFYVNSSISHTFLIRALGPALAQPGALATPELTLTGIGGSVMATNTGWSNAPVGNPGVTVQPATAAIFSQAGVSPLPSGSADCAMVVTLAGGPGVGYGAQVSGVGGATGKVLLEITEVDSARSTAAAPAIVSQPQGLTASAGQTATLGVVVVGLPTPNFQWKKNGTSISGATNATYTVGPVQSTDAGSYSVSVTNASGSVSSTAATLIVNTLPAITTQPLSQTVAAGTSTTFAVVATGNPAPTYQWKFNAANIAGATSASYVIANPQTLNNGSYTVVASNTVGSVTSNAAILTVNGLPSFTTQPTSQSVNAGTSATLSQSPTSVQHNGAVTS